MTATAPTTFTLAEGVLAAFTGRDTGNLAHRRPHVPADLHAARRAVAGALGVEVADLHHMRQVHGGAVGEVGSSTTCGAEIREVDALFTDQVDRALVVQAADCVPVLVAADGGPIGVAHAGRNGVAADVVGNLVARFEAAGVVPASLHAAIGPAIGPCCYEVPDDLAGDVARSVKWHHELVARTTWGTTSLDLPGTVVAQLRRAGVEDIALSPGCTRCDPDGRWFSHRSDPTSGRHVGALVCRSVAARQVAA